MILLAFSVYDNKAAVWLSPFWVRSAGEATRAFADEARRDGPIGRHPADYNLFLIGEFDDQTGQLKAGATPVNFGLASDFLPKATQAPLPLLAPEPATDATGLLAARQAQQDLDLTHAEMLTRTRRNGAVTPAPAYPAKGE